MTMLRLLFAIGLAATLAAAQDQTKPMTAHAAGMSAKLSGTASCPQPSDSHAIQVGDHPGHMYTIAQEACTFTKPLEMAGLKSKDDTAAGFAEVDGNKSKDHSARVINMDNGDKAYVHTQGTSTFKDQKFASGEGTWSFAGGTGKLKGIKGKGTYKCGPEGDNVNCDIEGEYTLASK